MIAYLRFILAAPFMLAGIFCLWIALVIDGKKVADCLVSGVKEGITKKEES